mgnify:CR=1 FL=1
MHESLTSDRFGGFKRRPISNFSRNPNYKALVYESCKFLKRAGREEDSLMNDFVILKFQNEKIEITEKEDGQ